MISTAPDWGWAPTRSAGPPIATRRSRCSTRTSTRAAASSTPPTPTGGRASSGASETIIGEWFAARGRRDDVVLATKVGSLPSRPGLSAANITAAVDESLRRLQTDRIDLYWAHKDDPDTPQEETLAAFDGLVRAGKVREVGASNFSAARLESALAISAKEGLAAYVALQPHYNLMERAEFETTLQPVLAEHGLSCVPYFGLARGFLTGKYRPGAAVDSPRARGRVGLPRRARAARCSPCSTRWRRRTAWRWRPSRWPGSPRSRRWSAPLASARSTDQLADLLPTLSLTLTDAEVAALSAASRP